MGAMHGVNGSQPNLKSEPVLLNTLFADWHSGIWSGCKSYGTVIVAKDGTEAENDTDATTVPITFGQWPTLLKLHIAVMLIGIIRLKRLSNQEIHKVESGESLNAPKVNMPAEPQLDLDGNTVQISVWMVRNSSARISTLAKIVLSKTITAIPSENCPKTHKEITFQRSKLSLKKAENWQASDMVFKRCPWSQKSQ